MSMIPAGRMVTVAKNVAVVPWLRPVLRSYISASRRPWYSWPSDRSLSSRVRSCSHGHSSAVW
jgi:hypothetical protein